ncbi:MAG: hypothetical protein IT377_30585 [Polyangiaceae bacterium]|nr:hypothetical protein [Myxococcales bacterium]MCC6903360.1 hypothetical protein [Polyangiaceae bacterium]
MPHLKELAQDSAKRSQVIDDACHVLDLEVADKSGLSGLAIKAGYKVVQGVKPGFVRQAVDDLLDDFLDALDPIYQEAISAGKRPGEYLKSRCGQVADSLLSITDRRAENAQRAAVRSMYDKLRPTAKKHVEAAAPRLADLLEKHAPAS